MINQIKNRIFIGILLTPDLLYQLEKNFEWKQYRILQGDNKAAIQKIPFQQKEYFGKYLEGNIVTWGELLSESNELKKNIFQFFPKLFDDKCNIVIFNQTLIS